MHKQPCTIATYTYLHWLRDADARADLKYVHDAAESCYGAVLLIGSLDGRLRPQRVGHEVDGRRVGRLHPLSHTHTHHDRRGRPGQRQCCEMNTALETRRQQKESRRSSCHPTYAPLPLLRHLHRVQHRVRLSEQSIRGPRANCIDLSL